MSHPKKNPPRGSVGSIVLLCFFVVTIAALCVTVLLWNANRPKPPSASSSQGMSQPQSGAASSKPAASSASQKPAAAASSVAVASSSSAPSSESSTTPTVNPGPDGTYLLNTESDIRAAAFAQMNTDNQGAVGDNQKTASIATVVLQGAMGEITDFNYVGQEVYRVRFLCKDAQRKPPELTVFLAKDTGKMIGYGYYD